MLKIGDNIDAFWRSLSDVGRKQLPFAVAMALNDTAEDVAKAEEQSLEKSLDRPTPYTKRGIYRLRASKSRLRAEIGVKRVQEQYLRYQVDGGVRKPKGRAIVIPVGQRRNQYGNMPKGAVRKAAAKADTFVASRNDPRTKHLRPGIYQRPKRGRRGSAGQAKLLVAFASAASYNKRWDFKKGAEKKARSVFPQHLGTRWRQALATAK